MTRDDTAEIIGTLRVMITDPVGVVMNMPVITQMATLVALACAVIATILAIVRSGRESRSGLLTAVGIVGLVAGIVGAAYAGLRVYIGLQMTHVTRFAVIEPEIIEIAFCLIPGLLAWLIARIGNRNAVP